MLSKVTPERKYHEGALVGVTHYQFSQRRIRYLKVLRGASASATININVGVQ